MKFSILIVRNNLVYSVEDDIAKFAQWVSLRTPLTIEITFLDTKLPVSYKDFGVIINGTSHWGLSGIKEQLRTLNNIPFGEYHAVFFMYQLENWDNKNSLGVWTYPNHLQGAAFVEIPCTKEWEHEDRLFKFMRHEVMHCFHRLAWWRGVITQDTMDRYDKEDFPEAIDGNYARNFQSLSPHWGVIGSLPIVKQVAWIFEQLRKLILGLTMPKKLDQLVDAIQTYEGWHPPGKKSIRGSRSYRNNNPGNLKYTPYTAKLGAYSKDAQGFAIFRSLEDGRNALKTLLTAAANLTLKSYREYAEKLAKTRNGEVYLTLLDLFEVYAPTFDANEPKSYAMFVAGKLGVDPKTKLKEIVE